MSVDHLPGTIDSDFSISHPRPVVVPRESFLQAIRQTWRSYGLGAALRESVYRLARRLVHLQLVQVLRLDLAAMPPLKPPVLDLDYRFLTAAEIRPAAADPAYDLSAAMAERLQSGRDYCFGAFHAERLVNYSWYALESIEPEHGFISGFTFPQDTVFLYKAYTLPAYRGQQIHGATLRQAVQFFQQRGITQLIGIVEFANWASLRSHENLGCRPAGRSLRVAGSTLGRGCGSLRRS